MSNQKLLFKKLVPGAHIPTKEHATDAGLDLRSIESVTIEPGTRATVDTGVAVAIPRGMVGLICPRSGLAHNHGITVLNAPGIIDCGYINSLKIIVLNTSDKVFNIEPGNKIAQLVITPFQEYELEEVGDEKQLPQLSERGLKGLGSSGA